MSIEALCQATATHLRSALELDDTKCDLAAEGQPPPIAGMPFIGVHDGGWTEDSGDQDLTEVCTVLVTVTWRIGDVPIDRVASNVIYQEGAKLRPVIRKVITAIHKGYANIINIANLALSEEAGEPVNGFIKPLYFLRGQPVQFKGPAWFYSTPREGSSSMMCGVARTLVFGKATRVQRTNFMR